MDGLSFWRDMNKCIKNKTSEIKIIVGTNLFLIYILVNCFVKIKAKCNKMLREKNEQVNKLNRQMDLI